MCVSKIKSSMARLGSDGDENWSVLTRIYIFGVGLLPEVVVLCRINCDMNIDDIAEAYAQMALVTVR